jgi:hypothetical protein
MVWTILLARISIHNELVESSFVFWLLDIVGIATIFGHTLKLQIRLKSSDGCWAMHIGACGVIDPNVTLKTYSKRSDQSAFL